MARPSESAAELLRAGKSALVELLGERLRSQSKAIAGYSGDPMARAAALLDELEHWLGSSPPRPGEGDAMQSTRHGWVSSILELQVFRLTLFEFLVRDRSVSTGDREAILSWVDLHERKRFEEEVGLREREYRLLPEAIPQIVWSTTPQGQVTYCNQNFYKYVGVKPEEILGDGWMKALHPQDLRATLEVWGRSLRTGESFSVEHRLRAENGDYRWHLSRACPLRNEAGEILKWFGTATDIEQQKIALEHLEEERALRENLIAALSHDLRGPLTTARIGAELLMEHAGRVDLLKSLGPKIVNSLRRANQMIEDLLDASRLQGGKAIAVNFAPCNLVQVARQAIDELSLIHGERFVLEAPGVAAGVWSADGLRRVIENLCSNAVKYGAPEKPIVVAIEQTDDRCRLAVINEGSPMPPEELAGLFHQFQRSESVQRSGEKGWGLGLTIVRGIIQAHGGRIWVKSEAEGGTSFIAEIPTRAGEVSLLSELKAS